MGNTEIVEKKTRKTAEKKPKLKTLVSCKPSEFLRQTNRIKKAVEKWLKDTNAMEIRRRAPELIVAPENADAEARASIIKENAWLSRQQAAKNLSDIMDAALEKYPEETLDIMALCCFVEPEDVDDHTVQEYIAAISELLNDEAVLGFFISLGRLAQTGISTAARA